MIKHIKTVILIAWLISLMTACAANPVKPTIQTNPDFKLTASTIQTIAIIADVCIQRDALQGDDYWSIKDSRLAGLYMLKGARTALEQKGYTVVFVEAPFVGSFKNESKALTFAIEKGAPTGVMFPPLFVADELAGKPAYQHALTTLIKGTMMAVAANVILPTDICCEKSALKEAVDSVAKKTGADAILFLIGNGILVPDSKSIIQGVTIGAITTALTFGMLTYSKWDVSWLDSFVGLVDSKTGELLWSNKGRLKGKGFTEKGYYSEKWSKSLLQDLPGIETSTIRDANN